MEKSDVGKFFGVIDNLSGVLQSLIDKTIFDNVEVFNYQALCPPNLREKSNAFSLETVSLPTLMKFFCNNFVIKIMSNLLFSLLQFCHTFLNGC